MPDLRPHRRPQLLHNPHLCTTPGPLNCQARGYAARPICDLTVPLQGKRTACEVPGDCTQKLTQLLLDDSSFVRVQSAAVLMRCVSSA